MAILCDFHTQIILYTKNGGWQQIRNWEERLCNDTVTLYYTCGLTIDKVLMSAVLLLLLLLVVIFILRTTIVIVAIMVMMIINHFLRECVSIYIIYTALYAHVPSRSHETSASPPQKFRSEELLPKIAWTKKIQDKLCVSLLSCSKVSRRGCTMIHVNNCKHI